MAAYLSSRQHPYAPLVIPGIHEDIKLDWLIDTGFAGGVAIPKNSESFSISPSLVKGHGN